MDNFIEDRKLRKIAHKENIKASDKIISSINETLDELPETENKINRNWRFCFNLVAVTIVALFVVLPNINPEIAYAMQSIPVIGKVVKVITIKNYFEKEGNSELEMEVPEISNDDDSQSDANQSINADVERLTQKVMKRYYEEKDENNHLSIQLKSEVIQNDENWFTLKLTISEVSGSSDTQYKYYNIDKKEDKIIELSDLFEGVQYKDIISQEIKRQMKERMAKDENEIYWIDSELEEWSFTSIADNQNYYLSENGNIVIVFDKYEVGPGYMGTPEFEIPEDLYSQFIRK